MFNAPPALCVLPSNRPSTVAHTSNYHSMQTYPVGVPGLRNYQHYPVTTNTTSWCQSARGRHGPGRKTGPQIIPKPKHVASKHRFRNWDDQGSRFLSLRIHPTARYKSAGHSSYIVQNPGNPVVYEAALSSLVPQRGNNVLNAAGRGSTVRNCWVPSPDLCPVGHTGTAVGDGSRQLCPVIFHAEIDRYCQRFACEGRHRTTNVASIDLSDEPIIMELGTAELHS